MNIKDDWQVRLCYKRASSRFENGNCDHKKDPFFLENTVDLIDLTFEETIGRFNGFQETIEHFNGFEETIGNFQWFLRRPSPLNVFWQSDHCHQWFFNGFWYCYHRFQWFSMVLDHWSNDAMVSMDRYGLFQIDFYKHIGQQKRKLNEATRGAIKLSAFRDSADIRAV